MIENWDGNGVLVKNFTKGEKGHIHTASTIRVTAKSLNRLVTLKNHKILTGFNPWFNPYFTKFYTLFWPLPQIGSNSNLIEWMTVFSLRTIKLTKNLVNGIYHYLCKNIPLNFDPMDHHFEHIWQIADRDSNPYLKSLNRSYNKINPNFRQNFNR